MASTVNIHEAKTQFSQLLKRVADGEEITIAKAGRPIARLVGIAGQSVSRKPGTAKGLIRLSDDFDAPLPDDIRRSFE